MLAMNDVILIQYDEIGLKGGRSTFCEKQLVRAVQNALRDFGSVAVEGVRNRFLIRLAEKPFTAGVAMDRLSRVFGVRYLLHAIETEPSLAAVAAAAIELVTRETGARSFGVRVRRVDWPADQSSPQIERWLGDEVGRASGLPVSLENPDVWIRVMLVSRRGLVGVRRVDGPGGLPSGSSGHGVVLLSGGIDSPVAAWMMMGRGLKVSAVHFHSAPFTSAESQRKVKDLLAALSRWQPTVPAAFIPFATTVQQAIIQNTPPKFRVLLYRRFMLRIAEKLARAVDATALITGDALGQVASQTIENLATTEAVAVLPVFRPLVGMGKEQIITTARRIGTYEISIRPHDDCCSYLAPRNPATSSTAAELDEVERSLPVQDLVDAAVRAREVFSVRFERDVFGS